MFQICLGIPWGADQSADTMKVMKDHLPKNARGAAEYQNANSYGRSSS